jgi:predicted PurR-regulated permease PerM
VALSLIGSVVYLLADQVVAELERLSSANPDSLASALRQLIGADAITLGSTVIPVTDIAQQIQSMLGGFLASPGSAIEVARQVGDIALNTALVIIVTFYLLVDGHGFIRRALSLVESPRRERVTSLLEHIHVVLGRWLRGELFLIVLVAIVVYLILGPLLGLHYALAIGVLTGVLEVIPLVGPVIAAGIAGVDAFVQGGSSLALLVIVIYVVLREVEDQLIMPVVIGRAVHLHPVVTIFAVLVGLSAFGILGGLLGVPAAAAANVVFNELYRRGPGAGAEAPGSVAPDAGAGAPGSLAPGANA